MVKMSNKEALSRFLKQTANYYYLLWSDDGYLKIFYAVMYERIVDWIFREISLDFDTENVEVIEESPYQIIFEIKTNGGISQLYLEPFDEGVITK